MSNCFEKIDHKSRNKKRDNCKIIFIFFNILFFNIITVQVSPSPKPPVITNASFCFVRAYIVAMIHGYIMRCAICCEKKRHLYQLCGRCKGEDKLQCQKCYSSTLYMNPFDDSIHIKCSFCRCYLPSNKTFKTFTQSFYYIRKVYELQTAQLAVRQMELDFHLNTIQHLESRLSLHIDRRNHRRSRLAQRLAESQREDDEEEAIEDETDVVPHPDLPNSFLSVLELFNTPISSQ